MVFSFAALGGNYLGSQAESLGGFDAAGLRFVGDDDGDAGVADFSGGDVAGDGFEVGAASGEEDA